MKQEDINEMIAKNLSPEAEIQYQGRDYEEVGANRAVDLLARIKQLQAELAKANKRIAQLEKQQPKPVQGFIRGP